MKYRLAIKGSRLHIFTRPTLPGPLPEPLVTRLQARAVARSRLPPDTCFFLDLSVKACVAHRLVLVKRQADVVCNPAKPRATAFDLQPWWIFNERRCSVSVSADIISYTHCIWN